MSTAVSQAAPRKRWNALQVLRGMRAALLLFDLVLLIPVLNLATEQRAGVAKIADRELPAVLAAERIKVALERMEGATAAETLQNSSQGATAVQRYEQRRSEVVRALMQAAESSPDQAAGEASLEALQLGLGTYERLVGVSRDLHSHGERGDRPAFEEADTFMREKLLPASNAVEEIETEQLKRSLRGQRERLNAARWGILFGCALELLILLMVQTSLSRRTNRTLNLALLGATFVLIVLGAHLSERLAAATKQLAALEINDFSSLHTLWNVRETAYFADLDLARGLLDPAHRGANDVAFARHAAEVLVIPQALTADQFLAALREGRSVEGSTGMLATELDREEPSVDRDTLLGAVGSWEEYLADGAQVQRLERTGQFAKAVQVYGGGEGSQAQGALRRFDQQMQGASDNEQAALSLGFSDLLGGLAGIGFEAGVGIAVLALLVVVGFAPRIREYR